MNLNRIANYFIVALLLVACNSTETSNRGNVNGPNNSSTSETLSTEKNPKRKVINTRIDALNALMRVRYPRWSLVGNAFDTTEDELRAFFQEQEIDLVVPVEDDPIKSALYERFHLKRDNANLVLTIRFEAFVNDRKEIYWLATESRGLDSQLDSLIEDLRQTAYEEGESR